MTTLQKDAVALIQEMPEEQIAALLVIMRAMSHEVRQNRQTVRHRAFEELERLRRPIPDLDEKRELTAWREEKFGNASTD